MEQVGTRTVTDIVKGLPDRFYGVENLFTKISNSPTIPPKYGERFINESDMDAGIDLERYIEGYLVHKKGFEWCEVIQPKPVLSNDYSIFGEVVWDLVKEIEPSVESLNPKMIEKPLKCYGITGRADCIIQRPGRASIIIDFKYTKHSDQDEQYKNPSRSFALQLLLYQWIVGKEFKEEEGAQLYIIRYYNGSNVMVLYQYQPPEDLQYSPAREKEYQPNVIDQVVEEFKKSLQHLEDENKALDRKLQELPDALTEKLRL